MSSASLPNTSNDDSQQARPKSLLFRASSENENFKKGIRASILAHAILAVAVGFLSVSFFSEAVKITPTIRVDLVGLPDFKKADLSKQVVNDLDTLSKKLTEADHSKKKPAELAKKTPDTPIANPDEMALKKEKIKDKNASKAELKSALDRIKALADIENDVKKSGKQKPTSVALKGNSISKGSALTGSTGDDINAFVGLLTSKIRSNWHLPVWLSKQSLNARIVVFFDRSGFINNLVVAKSSGNQQFDDFAVKTIRMSQPFGSPPEDLIDTGITLGFPL